MRSVKTGLSMLQLLQEMLSRFLTSLHNFEIFNNLFLDSVPPVAVPSAHNELYIETFLSGFSKIFFAVA